MSNQFRRVTAFLAVVTLICVFSTIVLGQRTRDVSSAVEFKNLGGSVDEVASMRLPAPSSLGTRSKSAMLPIIASEGIQEFDIPVDSADNFRLMLLAPNGKAMTIRASAPGEEWFDLRSDAFSRRVTYTESSYGLEGNQFPADVFAFTSIKRGNLRVQIEFPRGMSGGNEPVGYLVASSDSQHRLYSYVDTLQTTVGRAVGVETVLFDAKANDEDGLPASIGGAIRESVLRITTPDGKRLEFPMSVAADGLVRGQFVPTTPGRYTAQVFSRGTTPESAEFIRSSELSFDVAATSVRFGGAVRAHQTDDLRFTLSVPVGELRSGERVIMHAEVWGRDSDGSEFPVSWVGGMSVTKNAGRRETVLPVTLDARWLAQNTNAKSFFLRNVRAQSADGAILLGQSERIEMPGVSPTELAKSFAGIITDEMRQGVRPVKTVDAAVGGKLMVVHGYCSGDAWGSAVSAGQFSNYVKFLDLNQNRTHDQFANLIGNFGASLPSFGIVAHSQGGAASLHLYTYYWSGLDYATGSRLIQSVGTPYRGTALAGNLAILGQIFGAGCGSNSNLTYSGAASWLAGIPTSARAKVSYHTTSFTDVWYRYDYCNIATDPFLSDPDDGVVERAYAQLTGGINLGHKTGWCHTSGMRDPSQTNDASRNSNMNANAAR